MKLRRSAMPALLLGCVCCAALAGPPAAAGQIVQALNPPPSDMQTQGKVGETSYRWTNGRAWMSLNDDAKVAMVAGIEQGIILSVRENWRAVSKQTQPVLEKTATRLTVGGFSFNELVLQMDNFYMLPGAANVPVVDAYLYALMKLKQASDAELKDFAERLLKTYPAPPAPKEPRKH